MIRIEAREDGVVLPVKAQPGASSNGIRGEHDGMLRVAVTQVAEKGKANQAIVALLSKQLKLRKSQIALVSGETASQKLFLISEVTLDELAQRVSDVL